VYILASKRNGTLYIGVTNDLLLDGPIKSGHDKSEFAGCRTFSPLNMYRSKY